MTMHQPITHRHQNHWSFFQRRRRDLCQTGANFPAQSNIKPGFTGPGQTVFPRYIGPVKIALGPTFETRDLQSFYKGLDGADTFARSSQRYAMSIWNKKRVVFMPKVPEYRVVLYEDGLLLFCQTRLILLVGAGVPT